MNQVEPVFLVLIGIPGSGKSTWLAGLEKKSLIEAKYVIVNNLSFTVVCPDTIRQRLSHISDQSQNDLVWQKAKERTIDRLERGVNVILDATNVNTSRRQEFIKGLPPCRKVAKVFSVGPEQACLRIKKDLDEKKQRSDVPEEAVYKMYGEFLYTIRVIASEGFELLRGP